MRSSAFLMALRVDAHAIPLPHSDTFLPGRPDGCPVSLILPIDSPAFGELRCWRLLGGQQGLALKMCLDGRLYFCGYSPLVSLC
jgi:hypothetical protein